MKHGKTLLAFASVSFGLFVVAACGESLPKAPDVGVTPPVPSAPALPAAPDTTADSGAAATPAAPAKMTASECDALVDEANHELDAERIKVDKACKKDADCVVIKGRACSFACSNGAIPKAEQAEWDGTVTKVKDGQCKKWADNDCAKTTPPKTPTCKDVKPGCKAGHCITP